MEIYQNKTSHKSERELGYKIMKEFEKYIDTGQ
jgi:hypothetical protein